MDQNGHALKWSQLCKFLSHSELENICQTWVFTFFENEFFLNLVNFSYIQKNKDHFFVCLPWKRCYTKGKKTEKIESCVKKSSKFCGTDAGWCGILLSFCLVCSIFRNLEQHCCLELPRNSLPFFREETASAKKIKQTPKKAADFSVSDSIFI